MNTASIKLKTIIFSLTLGMALYGCSSNDAPSENNDSNEDQSAHNNEIETTHSESLHNIKEELADNEVLITEKQLINAGIAIGDITKQQLSKVVKSFGELALAPSDQATVSALIGGTIRNIKVIEGDYVQKDQVIARIVHPDIVDMQEQYLTALSQDEYLKSEYYRQKRLLEDSVNSEKTLQNARAAYQSNLAKLQSLKKKLRLIHINPDDLIPQNISDGYPIKSPLNGYVAQVGVNTGNNVTPQQMLFHITANDKVHIDLKVYEKDISKIAAGQKLTFNLANNPMAQPMEGKIIKMGKIIDQGQRTAIVHAGIMEMNENFLPGMSLIAYIQTGGKKQNTLPEAAFVTDEGKDYIFMLRRKGRPGNEYTDEEKHDGHDHEAGKENADHANEEQLTKAEHENAEENHFYVFEKVLVNKEITQGGLSSFRSDKTNIINNRFAINNAQALISEMKKGGGHEGHTH